MARLAAFLAAWLLPIVALAQGNNEEPPIADRPVDYSNIVGQWTMRVEAAPTDVRVEEAITLRIYLTGEGPVKYEPNRKHLKLLPDSFEADFFVQEMRDEHRVMRDAKTWLFVYRLKPKHDRVKEIEGIALWYFNPKAPGKRKFVPVFAPAIPIAVRPKGEVLPEIQLIESVLPDSFYEFPGRDAVLEHQTPFALSMRDIALVLALPPMACMAVVFGWRRCFPNADSLASQSRHRAASNAALALRGGGEPAATLVAYLRERFGFPLTDPTPIDVATFLRRRGFSRETCENAESIFALIDAGRYAEYSTPDRQKLTDSAISLIQGLEGDRCAQA